MVGSEMFISEFVSACFEAGGLLDNSKAREFKDVVFSEHKHKNAQFSLFKNCKFQNITPAMALYSRKLGVDFNHVLDNTLTRIEEEESACM